VLRAHRLLAAAALLVCLSLGAQAAERGALALVGGDVHTGTGEVLAGGTVVVLDGRITAVGSDVEVPEGAAVIDCAGKIVTPGLIDADSWLGLDSASLSARVPGAETRAADAFDPWDARVRTAREQGVTALLLGASREQTVGGLAAVVSTSSGDAAPLLADGPVVLNLSTTKVAGGLSGAQRATGIRALLVSVREREGQRDRWKRDLEEYEGERLALAPTKEEELLLPAELLERMRLWTPAARADWRVAVYKGMKREKEYSKPKSPAKPPSAFRDDVNLDTLAELHGEKGGRAERRAFVRAELSGDVDAALSMAREFRLDAVVAGGAGLLDHAKALARADLPVVVTHAARGSRNPRTPLGRRPEGLAAQRAAAGLRPAIGTGGAGASRFLRLVVAREIGAGLDPGDALAAVTSRAARAAGVDDVTGSLAVGKRADIVVWDADPFAATSRAEHVFIGGEEAQGADDH
jgi:imidazolonepropionase-like amidohydrolase